MPCPYRAPTTDECLHCPLPECDRPIETKEERRRRKQSEAAMRWSAKNPQKKRLYNKRWRESHKEQIVAYCQKNKKRINETAHIRYQNKKAAAKAATLEAEREKTY